MKAISVLAFQLLCVAILPATLAAQSADERVGALENRVRELEQQIIEMQREIEVLRAEEPEEAEAPMPEPTGSEKLLPDISVIVDGIGTASTDKGLEGRNQFQVRETEVAIQGYVYPQVRGDVFIAFEEEELSGRIEEAYASILQIGRTGLSANLGKKYIGFGKINAVHRERWPFVTQPFVVRNFLNPEEGLAGQGAQLNYLLPTRGGLFGQVSVGAWKPSGHEHEDGGRETGLGIENRVYSGRLWLSKPLGESAEVELGLSGAGGRGEEDIGNPSTRLYGIDLTWRAWPGGHRKVLFQGEAMRHKRDLPGGDGSRDGYYAAGLYRWDRYNEAGLRYDWSELPAPASGHDSGLSAFYTRWLSEMSYMRLQLTRGASAVDGDFTSAFLQFVWGLGPHAHQLE